MSASAPPVTHDAAPAPAPLPPVTRGRLRAYALWQMRDYLIQKGIGTVLVSALMLFIAYQSLREVAVDAGVLELPPQAYLPLLIEIVRNFVLFGILFATNGIVAEDRKFGYYRFYFAKPVGVTEFYAQKFIVHMIGFLLIGGALLGTFSLLFTPIFPPDYFVVLVLMFVGLGGIGFFLSSVTTADWVTLIGFYGLSFVGWTLYADHQGLRGQLVRLLPPVHKLSEIYLAMVHEQPLPMRWLGWVAAYGAVCFVLGLVILSRRKLATT